jgi:small GTP-binding protein
VLNTYFSQSLKFGDLLKNLDLLQKMEPLRYKVVLIGESGVGKTSLVYRYRKGDYARDLTSTIGMAFSTQEIVLKEKRVTLEIWDSAGQERFNAIVPMYYSHSNAILCCYDVHDPRSKEQLFRKWLKQLTQHFSVEQMPLIVLIGTKYDLAKPEEETRIREHLHQSILMAQKVLGTEEEPYTRPISGFLTSSITGENVPQLFYHVAKQLVETTHYQRDRSRSILHLEPDTPPPTKTYCCTSS